MRRVGNTPVVVRIVRARCAHELEDEERTLSHSNIDTRRSRAGILESQTKRERTSVEIEWEHNDVKRRTYTTCTMRARCTVPDVVKVSALHQLGRLGR